MGSILKEIVCQIKEIQSDLKNDTHVCPTSGEWSRKEVRKMKICLGKIILFTRSLRETFAENQESGDEGESLKALVLLRCTRYIKRLSMVMTLLETEEGLNKVNKTLFQLDVDTILFELECIVKEALKSLSVPQFPIPPYQEPSCSTSETLVEDSHICELNKLRLKLRNAEKNKELEIMGQNLIIMQQKTLVLQASKNQKAAEQRLAEEQDRIKALEECLSNYKLQLKNVTEQHQKLKKASNQLIRESNQIRPQKSWNVLVGRRKGRISTRTNFVWKSLKLDQSERETLMELKKRLSEEKEIKLRAKTEMRKIRKDMDELCLGKGDLKLKFGLQNEGESYARKDTLDVINKSLRALFQYNRLKFPDCNFKLSRLMKCLYGNIITIRERWIRKISSAVEPKPSCLKSNTRSLPEPPKKVSFSTDLFWDKIYKPCTQITPVIPNTSLIAVLPKNEPISLQLSTESLVPQKVAPRPTTTVPWPKYLGKTFGDRRLSLLRWCQERVKPYGIPMYEFCASWISGRALCAIMHSYLPDLVDETYLVNKKPQEVLAYGIKMAKSIGVSDSVDLFRELRQGRPNLEKIVDFVEELQGRLDLYNTNI
ncbi:cytospin-B [Drosophila mauritiana]|uniref:Cytospin-B n=1 Tax=Drosophila mauritiana TaxID=7226 RepID=A0A6P8KJ75_DROMA|nr:cytospin-B [Drosophila mauritiana]